MLKNIISNTLKGGGATVMTSTDPNVVITGGGLILSVISANFHHAISSTTKSSGIHSVYCEMSGSPVVLEWARVGVHDVELAATVRQGDAGLGSSARLRNTGNVEIWMVDGNLSAGTDLIKTTSPQEFLFTVDIDNNIYWITNSLGEDTKGSLIIPAGPSFYQTEISANQSFVIDFVDSHGIALPAGAQMWDS